ncbi:UDP-3-O-acyl-N-acetylglucosamine deacetylase [Acinetobacter marinus]|nr:UDP-3-O-acyl-N-acetylglucosamine deacetylase [Acinetobacter marinus]
MFKQRSIRRVVRASGIGLHSGKKVRMNFLPSECDTGIVFRRIDLNPAVEIPAEAMLIQEAYMCSNLVKNKVKIGTVEHVMSAIAGLGIDNLIIEIDAPEIPIMDGSAGPFIYLLLQGELTEQAEAKKFIKIKKEIHVQTDDKTASFRPFDGFELNFTIDFDHPAFDKKYQSTSILFSTENFVEQVSEARTFGFVKDLELLQANNLALGANLDNAIGLDEHGVVNEGGLRFSDEFVRHKILDAIGDLYLLGHQIIAKFDAFKSGHALNNKLLRAVEADADSYEIVTFCNQESCPIKYVPLS